MTRTSGRISAEALDELYERYGFSIQASGPHLRAYLLKQQYFHGVELVPLTPDADVALAERDYREAGYAVRERRYESIAAAEGALFDGFFRPLETRERLSQDYARFSKAQTSALGTYDYIPCPYSTSAVEETGSNPADVLQVILDALGKPGPQLVLIEAAAGFGKTCTAYEVLNRLLARADRELPLFTELSRNRQARIFRYVLLDEIDRHYPGLHYRVVTEQIKNGRIPLIIDGFDELLSKTDSEHGAADATKEFYDAETMLETIGSLLERDAKIILTTRRTAVFSGDEFHFWITSHAAAFETTRIHLEEPSIEDWLGADRVHRLRERGLPVRHISNPVLLSFLRNLSSDDFDATCCDSESIIDAYFLRLLEREQQRQALRMSTDDQLRIFRKLAELMAELNITSESKEFIRQVIAEQNGPYLEAVQKTYPAAERPSLEDLSKTLATHALLDRAGRRSASVGFVNDFVFGTLIGDAVRMLPHSHFDAREQILALVSTAYRPRSRENRNALWQKLELAIGCSNSLSQFTNDLDLLSDLGRDVVGQTFDGLTIEDCILSSSHAIRDTVFTNCKFIGVTFALGNLNNVGFLSCSFRECRVTSAASGASDVWVRDSVDHEQGTIALLGRTVSQRPVVMDERDYRREVLEQFWHKGRAQAETRRALRTLLQGFDRASHDSVAEAIETLRREGIIQIKGSIADLDTRQMGKIRLLLGRS